MKNKILLPIGLSNFAKIIQHHDTSKRHREKFYQGLMLGITACLVNAHVVTGNRESGQGRYDIAITPKDTSRMGLIMEIKVAASGVERLSELAQQALAQTLEKQYYTDMKALGIPRICTVGISFFEKEGAIEHKMVSF